MEHGTGHLLRNGLLEELWDHGREAGLAEVERGAGPFRAAISMACEGSRAPRRRALDPERVATVSEFAPPGGPGGGGGRGARDAPQAPSPRRCQDPLLRDSAPRRWLGLRVAIKLTRVFAGRPAEGIFACSPAHNPQKA